MRKIDKDNYVYRYIDKNDGIIKYVGITNNIDKRVEQHLMYTDPLCGGEWRIEYIEGLTRAEADMLETYYIQYYGTGKYYNKAKTKRGDIRFLNDKIIKSYCGEWKLYERQMHKASKALKRNIAQIAFAMLKTRIAIETTAFIMGEIMAGRVCYKRNGWEMDAPEWILANYPITTIELMGDTYKKTELRIRVHRELNGNGKMTLENGYAGDYLNAYADKALKSFAFMEQIVKETEDAL